MGRSQKFPDKRRASIEYVNQVESNFLINRTTKVNAAFDENFEKTAINPEMAKQQKSKTRQNENVDVVDIPPKVQIVWKNILKFGVLHTFALIGLYLFVTGQVLRKTLIWTGIIHLCGAIGTTAGSHRYWAHKSFKAKFPLKLILLFMQTISFQNSVWEWSRDHRLHHKYSETNADPHNAKRGFFFAHIGWLLSKKHPAVREKGKQIDLSDLESDPLIMFQHRFYWSLALTISLFIPAFVPWFMWNESKLVAWCFAATFRYCFNLHTTFLVNSAAHLWGDKPYDKNINPGETKTVSILCLGEGMHNYHHVFPWDYKTDELGHYKYNVTTAFIDFFAWIGWAYDLKTVSKKMVRDRAMRTGDGSWEKEKKQKIEHGGPWGWGDKDISERDVQVTETLFPMCAYNN